MLIYAKQFGLLWCLFFLVFVCVICHGFLFSFVTYTYIRFTYNIHGSCIKRRGGGGAGVCSVI